ncbi:hypothetical protein Tco_0136582, partial [Tanacetum coccineum]
MSDLRLNFLMKVVDEGEPTGSTALEATIATGSGETVHG